MIKKICSRCGIEKDIHDFNTDKSRIDNLHPYCKKCRQNRNTRNSPRTARTTISKTLKCTLSEFKNHLQRKAIEKGFKNFDVEKFNKIYKIDKVNEKYPLSIDNITVYRKRTTFINKMSRKK